VQQFSYQILVVGKWTKKNKSRKIGLYLSVGAQVSNGALCLKDGKVKGVSLKAKQGRWLRHD
jgi:hypothetical protein